MTEWQGFEQVIDTAATMLGFPRPWCVTGGWALDLWQGSPSRQHGGVTLAILREHQVELRDHLPGWQWFVVGRDGRHQPWTDRQQFMMPVVELCAREPGRTGRNLRVMLNESDGVDWRFSWNLRITRPLGRWRVFSNYAIPLHAPEIVLLHKSRRLAERDQLDFRTFASKLDDEARSWLSSAIALETPDHPWLGGLS
jgi:hypothetical protein